VQESTADLALAPPPYSRSEGNQQPESSPRSTFSEQQFPQQYDPNQAGTSTPRVPRANFVHVITPQQPIRGVWYIETTLPPMTRGVNQSRGPPDGSKPNLFLSSEHQSISAVVHLAATPQSGQPLPPRALVVAETLHRNITISIASRTPSSTKFLLRAASTHGNIVVRLPRDFVGPVRYRSETMRFNSTAVRFTPGIRQNQITFAQEETEGYAFIGDLSASGYLTSAANDEGPSSSTASTTSPSIIGDVQESGERDRSNAGEGSSRWGWGSSTSQYGGTSSTNEYSAEKAAPEPSSPARQQPWKGDELEVVSLYGRIKICYEGEVSEESELERFSRHLKESGPIVSVVKFATRKIRLK
jgi:hypothetical protein